MTGHTPRTNKCVFYSITKEKGGQTTDVSNQYVCTLMRAAQRGLRTLLGSVACVQCLKERARNNEACCLMEGFLLSITDRMSSDRFWRVVWKQGKFNFYVMV